MVVEGEEVKMKESRVRDYYHAITPMKYSQRVARQNILDESPTGKTTSIGCIAVRETSASKNHEDPGDGPPN